MIFTIEESLFNRRRVLYSWKLENKIPYLSFQSSLREIGESRMECDYRLVENEGLFQEYLEMGKTTLTLNICTYWDLHNTIYHKLNCIFFLSQQCSNSDSSRSSWLPSRWPPSSPCSITGSRFDSTLKNLSVKHGERWPSGRKTSGSGSPSWTCLRNLQWSPMWVHTSNETWLFLIETQIFLDRNPYLIRT